MLFKKFFKFKKNCVNQLNFSEINKVNCKNYIFLRFCLVERIQNGMIENNNKFSLLVKKKNEMMKNVVHVNLLKSWKMTK